MDIDKQIEAYLLSHKKQFSRLSKEGVARVAYLAGFLAAQQSVQADGGLCVCGGEGSVILGDGREYCNLCKRPRR